MPIHFDCRGCEERWWSPPGTCCPNCGFAALSDPDPVIWDVSVLEGESPVFFGAQIRDDDRLRSLHERGIRLIVDVAGDPDGNYVYRSSPDLLAGLDMTLYTIANIEDINTEIPDWAFDVTWWALTEGRRTLRSLSVDHEPPLVYFHCAAGLKRSPHLLYGVLRRSGYSPENAWKRIVEARPFVDRWDPYIDSAESWVSSRLEGVGTRE